MSYADEELKIEIDELNKRTFELKEKYNKTFFEYKAVLTNIDKERREIYNSEIENYSILKKWKRYFVLSLIFTATEYFVFARLFGGVGIISFPSKTAWLLALMLNMPIYFKYLDKRVSLNHLREFYQIRKDLLFLKEVKYEKKVTEVENEYFSILRELNEKRELLSSMENTVYVKRDSVVSDIKSFRKRLIREEN